MRNPAKLARAGILIGLLVPQLATVRAETVEEIVAWVNGEIITSSELEEEEQLMIAEAYRRFTGEELDERVAALRQSMLIDIIDRKILLDRARMMFTDLEQIKEVYYRGFKESQGISDDEELARMLRQEGMTVEQFKSRLLHLYAPDEVLRIEVRDRISISDREVEEYYADHPEEFVVPDQVTIREIVLKARGRSERERRRAEALGILEELRAGADFAEVAQRVSEAGTSDEGGLLGPLPRGDLSKHLESVAFDLPVGEVSDLIEADYGFHILRVESRQVGDTQTLEVIRERLRRYLEERRYLAEVRDFKEKMRSEAEWCVKPKFQDRIGPEMRGSMRCESL